MPQLLENEKKIVYPTDVFGSVAQLVRAPSLYLGVRWFESIQTHHGIPMYFIVGFLLFLSIVFGIMALRSHHGDEYKFLAICFFMAALGSGLVTFFAMQAIAYAN